MRIEAETIDERLVDEVRGHCAPLREAGVDTVILGCTHYPLVRPIIQRMLGPETSIVTSGAPLARQVEHVLGTRGLDSPREGEGSYGFLCTGEPAAFRAQGTRFLQLPLGEVGPVRLGGAVAA
jgi:glutamate racemase